MKKYLVAILGLIMCVGFTLSCKSVMTKTFIDTVFSGRDIKKLLANIDSTQALFKKVDKNISQSRNYLFDFAANQERKSQLKAREKELAELNGDIDRLTIELKKIEDSKPKKDGAANSNATDSTMAEKAKLTQLTTRAENQYAQIVKQKEEIIYLSRTNGDLEKVKLTGKQVEQIRDLIWNLNLATIHSQSIAEKSVEMMSNGAAIIANAKPTDLNYAKEAPKLKQAVESDLPELKKRSEYNVTTLKAFTEATNLIRKNNSVPDSGNPTKDDNFRELKETF